VGQPRFHLAYHGTGINLRFRNQIGQRVHTTKSVHREQSPDRGVDMRSQMPAEPARNIESGLKAILTGGALVGMDKD
jgi:hypothetical protein